MSTINSESEPWNGHSFSEVEAFIKPRILPFTGITWIDIGQWEAYDDASLTQLHLTKGSGDGILTHCSLGFYHTITGVWPLVAGIIPERQKPSVLDWIYNLNADLGDQESDWQVDETFIGPAFFANLEINPQNDEFYAYAYVVLKATHPTYGTQYFITENDLS